MNNLINKFVNKFKQDGVDHIRISPFASTTLGKVLSPDWRKKFFIPHLGEFLTPQCFANWLVTGDEDARHNIEFRPAAHIKDYSLFVLYGKYYQLCSMRTLLNKEMKDLPFVMYKVHTTGVKEFHRWKEYAPEVKDMVQHILDPERGSKKEYPWGEKYPGLAALINTHIVAIAGENTPVDGGKNKTNKAYFANRAVVEPSNTQLDKAAKEKLKALHPELSDEELDELALEKLRQHQASPELSDEELDARALKKLRKHSK